MSVFHRFCSLFPALIAILLLVPFLMGCESSPNMGVWNKSPQTQGVASPTPSSTDIYKNTAAPSASPVKVAILLPLSGDKSTVGQSMLQAAQLAVFDIGYDNFELLPIDTMGTENGAALAAKSALSNKAQIILGPLYAQEVRAVKSATAGHNINVLAFSTDWTLAGGNTFIMGFLPFGQVERIADFAAKRGFKNTAILSTSDTYGMTAASAFENAARAKSIITTRTNAALPSNDSVFIPVGGQDLAGFLNNLGNSKVQKLGTGLWDDPRVAQIPAMNGAWFAAPSNALRIGFESKYQSTYGAPPLRVASLAYDATALCVALAKLGASRGAGPAFAYTDLTNPSGFSGIDGIIRFNKNNMAERGLSIMEIRNGRIIEIDTAPTRF